MWSSFVNLGLTLVAERLLECRYLLSAVDTSGMSIRRVSQLRSYQGLHLLDFSNNYNS